MSAKAINEATGKRLLNEHLAPGVAAPCEFAVVNPDTRWETLRNSHPWLATQASAAGNGFKLVVKPDQLIKRRGKLGLIHVNGDLKSVQDWVQQRMDKEVEVGRAKGKLRHFIIEPFCKHSQDEEAYVCIYSHRNGDTILFHHEGGVDIGDVDSKALRLEVPIDHKPSAEEVTKALLTKLPQNKQSLVATFICSLYDVYVDLYFTYLEINPLGE
ncbi:hypothetical protein HPB52_021628 [Rhipicephalus sanguineus]|uniref:ATP-citrate synthase ATP-grasp domain-containing protein n=1 Tax=Rhipicephalus sanguineus TaxID=34632 RepID=A0A9D4T249_RHISA|nr:hypothetical protein HPB52_021628 [Rhipicephalus sanguineus]